MTRNQPTIPSRRTNQTARKSLSQPVIRSAKGIKGTVSQGKILPRTQDLAKSQKGMNLATLRGSWVKGNCPLPNGRRADSTETMPATTTIGEVNHGSSYR
jgi:hypothetical protein